MPFTMSGNNDGWSFNRFNEYEAKLKGEKVEEATEEVVVEEETLEEGSCGSKGYQEGGEVKDLKHRDAKTGEVTTKPVPGKTYYTHGDRAKSSVAIRKEKEAAAKKMQMQKEALEATGLFSTEEVEALLEGMKGYQKGGKVDCEKCKGKGCDHCDDKGTHKKSEKSGAKPDYLDFDEDGNEDEPMTKALKEKGGKKS